MSSTILRARSRDPGRSRGPSRRQPATAYKPGPINLEQRVGDLLLITIFKGHEEYLGWTPD